jgi:hypothetical protein
MREHIDLVEPYHNSRNRPSTDVLKVKQGQIGFSLQFPEIKQGIVHVINQYGKLYYGTMLPSVFYDKMIFETKNHFIKRLITLNSTHDDLTRISFVLELCRELLKSGWYWPGLMNRLPDGVIGCRVGRNRVMATMLTVEEPWKKFPVLFYEKTGFDVRKVLEEDYVSIDNLQSLQQIFKLEDTTSSEPIINLTIRFDTIEDIFWPRLESISGKMYDIGINAMDKEEFGLLRSDQYANDFLLWRSRYQSRPTLHVYTDWPESMSDVNSVWNVVHAGPSTPIIELIQGFGNRPAILEKPCLELHSDPSYTTEHTLYIVDDKKIDVGDFLPWIDINHTTFIDENWKFIMYRKDQVYKNTFVKIGRS